MSDDIQRMGMAAAHKHQILDRRNIQALHHRPLLLSAFLTPGNRVEQAKPPHNCATDCRGRHHGLACGA